jgi:hypothetical protein
MSVITFVCCVDYHGDEFKNFIKRGKSFRVNIVPVMDSGNAGQHFFRKYAAASSPGISATFPLLMSS